jgi:hypothetical protein
MGLTLALSIALAIALALSGLLVGTFIIRFSFAARRLEAEALKFRQVTNVLVGALSEAEQVSNVEFDMSGDVLSLLLEPASHRYRRGRHHPVHHRRSRRN